MNFSFFSHHSRAVCITLFQIRTLWNKQTFQRCYSRLITYIFVPLTRSKAIVSQQSFLTLASGQSYTSVATRMAESQSVRAWWPRKGRIVLWGKIPTATIDGSQAPPKQITGKGLGLFNLGLV
jgi:hypothetical protein